VRRIYLHMSFRRIVFSAMLPLGLVTLLAGSSWLYIRAEAAPSRGIDVSSWQGRINWSAVAGSGISFAYVRAGEGAASADAAFHANWTGAKAAGITTGAYLFFHPAADPVSQANVLLQQLRSVNFQYGDLLPAIDVEVTDNRPAASIVSSLQVLISAVQWSIGSLPVIYTSPAWWDGHVSSSRFTADPLWVANWGVASPSLPASGWGGNGGRIWQYTDAGSAPGIGGAVDMDQSIAVPLPFYALTGVAPTQTQLHATNVAGQPQAVSDGPGDIDVAWRGTDNRLWTLGFRNGRWSDNATSISDANLAGDPALVSSAPGRIDAFYRGSDGGLWQVGYRAGVYGQGAWFAPVATGQGAISSVPVAVSVASGAVDVFWIADSRLMVDRYAGVWSGAAPVSAVPAAEEPTAVPIGNGSVAVFWRDPSGELWEADIQAWGWGAARPVGVTVASDPVAITSAGVIDLFWTGGDGALWHISQMNGVWGRPGALVAGSTMGRPTVVATTPGVITVDLENTTGMLATALHVPGIGWIGPQLLGDGPVGSNPSSVAFGGTAVDVFWRSMDNGLWFSAACPACTMTDAPVVRPFP
jgi:GH25 family lysozyme M1 (1,4-beta-N-acetylmuramidase)